jgi:hypothetical protein
MVNFYWFLFIGKQKRRMVAQEKSRTKESEFVRLLREYKNRHPDLSDEAFAGEIGVSRDTFGNWLTDGQYPSAKTLETVIPKITGLCKLTDAERKELVIAAGGRPETSTDATHEPEYESDFPNPKHEPFLKFHEQLIGNLVKELSSKSIRENKILVLHGALGTGRSRIAHEVAFRLKSKDQFTIFHKVDHVTMREDASEAVEILVEHISSCLHFPATMTIDEKKQAIRQNIGRHNCKLVLCGIREDIQDDFFKFLDDLSNVRILITHTNEIRRQLGATWRKLKFEHRPVSEVDGDSIESVREFLTACEVKPISDDDVAKIGKKTKGDTFAIRQVVNVLTAKPVWRVSTVLDEPLTLKDQFDDFLKEEQLLLKVLSLFRAEADGLILSRIAWPDLGTEEQRERFNNAVKKPLARGVITNPNKPMRFSMEEPYRTYALKLVLENDAEKRKWKRQWVKTYIKLRPQTDSILWASTTDYMPDDGITIHYADEVENIIDVVRYCIHANRLEEFESDSNTDNEDKKRKDIYWSETAAQLMSNFRASFYASGNKWEVAKELCNKALWRLIHCASDSPLIPDMERQVARRECFQDDYTVAKRDAENAKAHAISGIKDIVLSGQEQTHNPFRAIYYRTLITLGEIAIREGNQAKSWGRFFFHTARERFPESDTENIQKLKTLETQWILKSHLSYVQARDYFNMAKGFVEAEFPPEMPFANYYLAEAEYYGRDTFRLWGKESVHLNLETSQKSFNRALNEWDEKHRGKEHYRLKAHITYYLGKIYRRLGTYDDAEKLLTDAKNMAEQHTDSALAARAMYTLGQLYFDKAFEAMRDSSNSQVTQFVDQSRSQTIKAALAFHELGMVVESTDATAFLLRPIPPTIGKLKTSDIPQTLRDLFRQRLERVILQSTSSAQAQLAAVILKQLFPYQ